MAGSSRMVYDIPSDQWRLGDQRKLNDGIGSLLNALGAQQAALEELEARIVVLEMDTHAPAKAGQSSESFGEVRGILARLTAAFTGG